MARPTVLLVDDEAQIRRLLTKVLESEGLHIEAVGTGEKAVARLELDSPVDLVLLDVGLPGISGIEVCRHIKAQTQTRLLPVIIVTGFDDIWHRVAGIEAGADDFLTKPFERTALLARVRSLLRLKAYTDELEHAESVLFTLARSIEARDSCTSGHCERLSNLAGVLGRHLGLEEEQLMALWKAGVVHDLGKIAIPDAILLKPGPLTQEERRIVELHPITGDEICRPIKSFGLVRPIIRHHHERMDGSGYPDGLSGTAIPITARVLQVVDIFDALVSVRPYKRAFTIAEALVTLREEARRGWWDQDVVDAFCELVPGQGIQRVEAPSPDWRPKHAFGLS